MPWLLFELPVAVQSTVPDLTKVRFALEPALLLSTWALLQGRVRGRAPTIVLGVVAALLVALRIDQWICLLLMNEEPLLYDQWFMLRHLGVLLGDLMSARTLIVLLVVGLAGWGIAQLVRVALDRARGLFVPPRRAHGLRGLGVFWAVALALIATGASDPWLHALTPALAANLRDSRAVYRDVQAGVARSPYADYDAIALHDKPDVLLFIVESYGRLLSVEPGMRAAHAQRLAALEAELTRAGWHAASAFSTAPVSGGRSWIAEGSMLMGTSVRYESVFQHLVAARPPNLVGFLGAQGYETVLLVPADRDRPGARVVNRYGFSRVIAHAQLDYRGPSVGWGIVPDQFSLAVAEARVLSGGARPVFLDFHMVSSHAPWEDVPALVDDPLALGTGEVAPARSELPGTGQVLARLARYDRANERRFVDITDFDARLRGGYEATIDYDLRLIARYLQSRPRDALVVVVGDHQPPVLARGDESFDAPVHVLARDATRLSPLVDAGFAPGLTLAGDAPPRLAHAGLFSLIAHALAARGHAGPAPTLLLFGQ
ncbi:MAG: hypothetical protein ABW252_13115 [Polyangiales bacterium]